MYLVVEPIVDKRDPRCWTTARVISRHRLAEKAYDYIALENRNLKRIPGFRNCRRDYYVIDSKTYELVEYLEDLV